MKIFIIAYYISCFTILTKCSEGKNKSKNLFPYFRRQVEELVEDTTRVLKDESRSNLVSFLVNNVKQIFDELDDSKTEIYYEYNRKTTMVTVRKTGAYKPKLTYFDTNTDDVMLYENLTLPPLEINDGKNSKNYDPYGDELLHLSKDTLFYGKDNEEIRDNNLIGSNNSEALTEAVETRRSCIFCNNVDTEDCNNPSNKLIPSTVCEGEDDLCYSQHTPFGIIDRGCFNIKRNLTTYVCSCNLCNYISISEMPYIFSKKQDWVDNVVELTRTKHFRKSIFQDMSCLRCEVNATTKKGDMLDSANCLEGNIGNIPTQKCKQNEVCGVRAIRSDGYIWRGCVNTPLYNYWWTLCDNDLCNYDPIASIYDFL